eukprot:scaffold101817_cov63-Phaeocystis_antarctica.AAC.4
MHVHGSPRAAVAASPHRARCRPWRAAPAVRVRVRVRVRVWVRVGLRLELGLGSGLGLGRHTHYIRRALLTMWRTTKKESVERETTLGRVIHVSRIHARWPVLRGAVATPSTTYGSAAGRVCTP